MSSKINQALLEWLPGDIHGSEWLSKRGIGQRLAYKYFETGVLNKVGPGVFSRKNDKLEWLALVRFLQQEAKLPLHISGRTALEIHGHGHYVNLGKRKLVYLTGYENMFVPKWIKLLQKDFELITKKSSLLKEEKYLESFEDKGFQVKISSRELAAMEFIETVDLTSSLETVENYLNSLRTLRPNIVQKILEESNSIKAKRVFLFLSEKLALPYFKELNLSKIELGTGKRLVVRGGELNSRYLITVDRKEEENPF